MIKSNAMNERQQAHINYFLKRFDHWMSNRNHIPTCRMLAARDADEKYPLRNEEEAGEVFAHLLRLEQEVSTD